MNSLALPLKPLLHYPSPVWRMTSKDCSFFMVNDNYDFWVEKRLLKKIFLLPRFKSSSLLRVPFSEGSYGIALLRLKSLSKWSLHITTSISNNKGSYPFFLHMVKTTFNFPFPQNDYPIFQSKGHSEQEFSQLPKALKGYFQAFQKSNPLFTI